MSSSLRRRPLSLVLAAALPACVESTAPEETVTVTPISTRIVRDSLGFATVSYRVSNPSRVPVYLGTCGAQVAAGFDLRAAATTWTSSFDGRAACYSSLYVGPYRLEPGQSVEGTQSARFAAGEYRISIPVSRTTSLDGSRTAKSASISIF
jgi:hypothetical protein